MDRVQYCVLEFCPCCQFFIITRGEETAALRNFGWTYVSSGSNSAVSRFLRQGCFTPETGHCSARLARQKSATSGQVVGYFENLVSKIGMTQNISPSFTSSHSTSLGDASPTTVRSANLDACEGPTRRQIGQTSPQGSSASVERRLPCALHMR
jgi:hypothetical protein